MSLFTTAEAPVAAEVKEVVLKELAEADQPITAGRLRERLRGPFRLREDALTELLEQEVTGGRVHRFQPYGGKKPRYWTRPMEEYARSLISGLVSRKPLTRSEIKARSKAALRGCSEASQREILDRLVKENVVRKLPSVVGGRTDLFSSAGPDPRDYLQDAIAKIAKKLADHGVTREDVLAAAASLKGNAASGDQADSSNPSRDNGPSCDREREGLILHFAAGYEGAVEGAPVPIKELRQAVGQRLTKEEFDEVVLGLLARGKVYFHQHDQPLGLSETDRSQLVWSHDGRCFVSLILKEPR